MVHVPEPTIYLRYIFCPCFHLNVACLLYLRTMSLLTMLLLTRLGVHCSLNLWLCGTMNMAHPKMYNMIIYRFKIQIMWHHHNNSQSCGLIPWPLNISIISNGPPHKSKNIRLLFTPTSFISRTCVNFFLFFKFLPMKVRQWRPITNVTILNIEWNPITQLNNVMTMSKNELYVIRVHGMHWGMTPIKSYNNNML